MNSPRTGPSALDALLYTATLFYFFLGLRIYPNRQNWGSDARHYDLQPPHCNKPAA
ncbi:hypothetical protein BDZ91DRAFT_709761 [Kalaharituber pfeilii]|nr:hypothetical protein BDZ91DRAFT_709761 [Kalaharituber pfeilii]